MVSGYLENWQDRGKPPADFQVELMRTIQEGQLRTVIITCDEEGTVIRMFFPIDDLELRRTEDIAACEFIPLVETDPRTDVTKTVFGHLGIKNGQIIVTGASNSNSEPVDDTYATQLVQNYFTDTYILLD